LKGPEVPLTSFENSLMLNNCAPAYMILENIHLVAEAMGLGAVMFGGYQGQVMLGVTPLSKGLGFRPQIGRDGKANPVGLDGIFEAYSPPYYESMNEAVDAFIKRKFGPTSHYAADYEGVVPFKNWRNVQSDYNRPSNLSIEQVKGFLNYVFDTYGRIPATSDTKLLPVWLQVHHLDLDFYEEHFAKDLITETQRRHIELWHK